MRPAAVLTLFAVSAAAQFSGGRLEGVVLDPAATATPGANITLRNAETSAERRYVTGSTGLYSFPALPPGAYRLTVEKAGFKTAVADVRVSSSQIATQNFTLQIADQNIALEVAADAAPHLNAAEALRGATRNRVEIAALPNLNRNIVNIVTLAPGVTPAFHPRGGSLTTLSIAQAGQINANGGRSKATAHQLDFTDANDWEFGGIALATQPAPDMLQEVRLLTNNWSAEYGVKASAQVVMITNAGSNALHGSAYDFLQNSALNARDSFDRSGRAAPVRQNFFGVTSGGPLIRNRSFLFGGYEGRRTRGGGGTFIAAVPSEQARASVTDASVQALLALLPAAAEPTADPRIGAVAVQAPSPSSSNQVMLRGDHYFAPAHSLTLRYFQNTGSAFNRTAGSLPGFDATFEPVGRNAMIADTWSLGARMTNELRLSYGRSSALFSPESEPATARFNVTGLAGFGAVNSWPQGRIFNVYQASDVLHRMHGRHALKAGVEMRRIQDNSINDSGRRGIFTFPSVEAFLTGAPSVYTQVFGNTYRGFRMSYHGVFMQDDWKIAPSLTLNLGVRWEYQGGLSEVNRLQSVLDPARPGEIGRAGAGPLGSFRNEKPVVNGHAALIAPRVGVAWNPRGGALVLRGGYGIYYDSFLFNGLQAGRTTPPSNYSGTLTGAQIQGANNLANLLGGVSQMQRDFHAQIGGFGALTNLGSVNSMLPDLRNPYMQHFSAGVQYRLAGSLIADASYVGTKGTALTTFGPANSVLRRPRAAVDAADERARLGEFQAAFARINGPGNTRLDARFNEVNFLRDNGSSVYHSMQLELRKSFSHGLQFEASYTFSKSIDNASDYTPSQATTDRGFAQNQFHPAGERGVSSFDIPHRVIWTHVWGLRGWTLSSINQWQIGIPYTVLSGSRLGIADVNMDGNLVSGLDNARANCSLDGRYSQPLLGGNGTCGRNTARMRNLLNIDWTLSKALLLGERGPVGSGPYSAEIRADFFNVFNVPFLTAAGDDFRNVSSPLFGVYNAAAPSRRVQVALRLTW